MSNGFDIGRKHIGDGSPCFIIAEVAQAHEGSVRIAHDFIDAIAGAGADAVKFQAHYAEHESTPDEPWRIEPKWGQDASRYAYWERTSFRIEDWAELRNHAREKGLEFLLSAFCPEAVRWLDGLVSAWKVPSGEIHNIPLLDEMTKPYYNPAVDSEAVRPVLISTGMATRLEVIRAVKAIRQYAPVALLQCTSEYPTPAEHVGLDIIPEWMEQFECPVGLSDHSGTGWPALAAVTLGASIVEVHVKLSEHDSGFDASSSITIEQLRQLVEGVRFIEKTRQPVDKDLMAKKLAPMRELFMGRHKRKAKTPPFGYDKPLYPGMTQVVWCNACDTPLSTCWHTNLPG